MLIESVDWTQDELEICQPIVINSDKLTERTEYFTVSLLRLPLSLQVAACQVAIVDKNGGKQLPCFHDLCVCV